METHIDRNFWANYFGEFTKRNQSRLTRLEVFGENGAQEEELGLPFAGISFESGNDVPRVQIMFGGHDPAESRHLTHVITNVNHITPKRGPDGRDEALEIVDGRGETSLLAFRD